MDDEQLQDFRMAASRRTIDALRAAATEDEDYILLIQQIAVGWPTLSADLLAQLRPYATFSHKLIVSGGLVYKGYHVVIPRGARDDIHRPLVCERAGHSADSGCCRLLHLLRPCMLVYTDSKLTATQSRRPGGWLQRLHGAASFWASVGTLNVGRIRSSSM